MKTPPNLTDSHPPRLIPTLVGGFNTVASHITLIILPVLIDLALWLGPKLRLKTLFLPTINDLTAAMLKLGSADLQDTIKATQKVWSQLLDNFNLGVALRTFPVGVPSLIARESLVQSPLAGGLVYETPTIGFAFLALVAFLLVGFFFGSLYFNALSRVTAKPDGKLDIKQLMSQYGQSLVMALILIVVVLILAIPGMTILSIFSLISPSLAEFMVLVVIFVTLWMALPLVFSPHGMFVLNQKAFPSMLLSIRMVRFFLPGTGLFVVTAALVSEGLNMLWTLPDPTSWLTLVGIGGHSFVVTALLAASFIYYREGLHWMQENIQRMSTAAGKPDIGGPIDTTRQQ